MSEVREVTTEPSTFANTREWLGNLMWWQAVLMGTLAVAYLQRYLSASLLFLLGAVVLIVAGKRIHKGPVPSLCWLRYAAGAALSWFLTMQALLGVVGIDQLIHGTENDIDYLATLISTCNIIPTLAILIWFLYYSRPRASVPGIVRRGLLVALCIGAAFGLPYVTGLWWNYIGQPWIQPPLVSICLYGYFCAAILWVVFPRIVIRAFVPFILITVPPVLFTGIYENYNHFVYWTKLGYPSHTFHLFSLVNALILVYAMGMVIATRGAATEELAPQREAGNSI